ncbi:RNA-directed DNA polymerase (reverse transcriptase)-related family protein [Rhynchospora pubera]|uniref:RNA-directed DNA polymerase (Reverse transcriptase)-related family protein n=1 Tax=Rhynchospora pubera TaxID=906938 RepID=A0AAV8DFZ5_9POAL|nr:RNA-directed DNA polymerase (reverse transcriptase)-related family protein [Rhynchospora pubera]
MAWSYMKQVLSAFGFPDIFIDLLMACVTSPTYTILVNGSGSGFITPQRGLRQGCPLSPYIFILAMEPLSILFKASLHTGNITGIKLASTAPPLTNCLYADDLMIMGMTDPLEVLHYHSIISCFASFSGQMVNPSKTKFWFSKNSTAQNKAFVMQVFGGCIAASDETYLGLPTDPKKASACDALISKISSRLATWKMNSLSQAGRLVLIKSVLQSIPVYQMTTQLLPKLVTNKITSIIRRFFWGKKETNYMPFCSWKRITRPLDQGGLAVKDIATFNKALVSKLAWKTQVNPDHLWCKILKAKYYPRRNFWFANNHGSSSATWNAICKIKQDFSKQVCWSIGDGKTCTAIGTPWHQRWELFNPTTLQTQNLKVADLCNTSTRTWDINLLISNFNLQVTLNILSDPALKPVSSGQNDRLVWKSSTTGMFSVRSAYKTMQLNSQIDQQNPTYLPWKIKGMQPKVKMYLWKLISGALPTALRLASRITTINPLCPRCRQVDETDFHILFLCPISRATWFASRLSLCSDRITGTISQFLSTMQNYLAHEEFILLGAIMWAIWEQRNCWVFSKKLSSPQKILNRAEYVSMVCPSDEQETQLVCMPKDLRNPQLLLTKVTIHTDGSWNLNTGGWGYLISKNQILLQFECGSTPARSPMQAEAIAILYSIRALKQICQQDDFNTMHVVLLSDCNNLIKAINNSDGERDSYLDWRAERELYLILQETQSLPHVTFAYLPRSLNQEAHILAVNGRFMEEQVKGFHFPTFKPP